MLFNRRAALTNRHARVFLNSFNQIPVCLSNIRNARINRAREARAIDVESLFTNVPLVESINLACEYLYNGASPPPFDKKHFRKLLFLATSGVFMFEDKLYRQVDGVTMGSPLGPTLANLFMAHHERIWLDSDIACKPKTFLRYVDDIFCVFDDSAHVNEFLNFLNSYHNNLKFTVEESINHSLSFLDCLVRKNSDCSFSTTVYRKPTYTGLMLNFCSVCPVFWKRGLVKCLLNRAYKICSSTSLFDEQVAYLRRMSQNVLS